MDVVPLHFLLLPLLSNLPSRRRRPRQLRRLPSLLYPIRHLLLRSSCRREPCLPAKKRPRKGRTAPALTSQRAGSLWLVPDRIAAALLAQHRRADALRHPGRDAGPSAGWSMRLKETAFGRCCRSCLVGSERPTSLKARASSFNPSGFQQVIERAAERYLLSLPWSLNAQHRRSNCHTALFIYESA